MTSTLLALASSLAFGASDFLGGLSSRRASMLLVIAGVEVSGLAAVTVAIATSGSGSPTLHTLLWGLLAGLGSGGGGALLYQGLAVGQMSVVAPVSAVSGAGLAVLVGVALGDRPGALAVLGIGLGLVAIVLLSAGSASAAGEERSRSGFVEGLGAGAGFAVLFVALQQAGTADGLWPLWATKLSSLALLLVLAAGLRQPMSIPRGVLAAVVAAGVLGAAGNALFLRSTEDGQLSIVSVVASLYPAATVILARSFLRERLRPAQALGLAVGAAAVAMIALG